MKIKEIMSTNPVNIHPDESVAVAARTLTHYNIGALPVCREDGKLCGMVSLGDLANRKETDAEAGKALSEISNHLSQRD